MYRLIIGFIVCCGLINVSTFAQQKVTIRLQHVIGNQALQLGATYSNSLGEDVIINRFKYYVSKIKLIDGSGKSIPVSKDCYLVDEADSLSKTIVITTSIKQISAIEFLLGVDSVRNVSGVQTGALDPLHGMFWTWNSGYIIAKLEGVSSVAKVPGNLFSQHIGGFKTSENTARSIRLGLSNFKLHTSNSILIEADINRWFQSVNTIRIAEHPVCHSPGSLAMQIADNYATMFKIVSIN